MWLDFDIFLVRSAAFQSFGLFLARKIPRPQPKELRFTDFKPNA